MANRFESLRSTTLAGVIFLIPLGALLVVVGKVVPVVKYADSRLMRLFPDESILGSVAMHLVALVIVLLLCVAAGVLARSRIGSSFMSRMEESLLGAFPMFSFFKGLTASMRESDQIAAGFTPVVVQFDDYSQMAFEIERIANLGKVAVYLPGAPNPWSGTVGYVDPERIRSLDMTVPEVVRIIRKLGKGTAEARDVHAV